jgi:tRNA-modifying protein YgfZ
MTEVVDLSAYVALRVTGTDAGDFLQAQLTCEVKALQAGQSTYGGYCTAKGRLLATFLLLREGESYVLLMARDIAEDIRRRLQMFVLRAKVDISVEDPPPTVFGEKIPGALQSIQQGIAWITAATQEAFVPQMINLEKIGGVSFKKGCYPGQEIVARTQYLGKASRRMHRVRCAAAIGAGDAVYGEAMGDQACGMVVNAAPAAEGWDALAVVHGEALDAPLHAQSLQGPILELDRLPYDDA